MKLTFTQILLAALLSSMAYAGTTKAQSILDKNVTITAANSTLQDVLKQLQKSSNVRFIYSKNSIDLAQRVSGDYQNRNLKDVLDELLKGNGIDYEVLKDRIVLGRSEDLKAIRQGQIVTADAETEAKLVGIPLTGKIIDERGAPLAGATITEKGTKNATVADGNGNFRLNVSNADAVLVVAFVSFQTQEVVVGSERNFTIKLLDDIKGLNEVVVVGYGTQKKSVTTGAISGVKAKEFEDLPVTRVEQILQGRTSGLTIASNNGQPGEGATVRIRGITSFGNNDPLWVVDGVVVDNGGIGYLNQSDIESIEVLKDAASQAIYGTRAAAGVILVTTKKGREGKPQINFTGYYGTSKPSRRVDLLNATQYATLRNEASVAGGGNIVYANPAALGTGTDWQSIIFNNSAKRQNYELSVSGGNEKSTYYTSFGYLDQEGIVATDISKYKRANFRVNQTYKPAKWISFGENIGYTYNRSVGLGNTNSEFGGPISSALNLDPITVPVVTDPVAASAAVYANNPVRRNNLGYPYGISSIVGQEIVNPLAYISTRLGNYGWGHNIVGNVYGEVEPIKGLKLRSTVGTKIAFYGSESFNPVAYLNASTITSQNSYNRETNRLFNWNLENTASYIRSFGKHTATVLVGQGAYSDNNRYTDGVTYYNLPVTTFADASLNYSIPAVNRIGYGSEGQIHTISSLFARVNYNYDERYIAEGIIRRDGSSRFGSNFKYGNFPSFSLGWVPSKEAFWPKNNVVDFLKIRGGYGVVGSDAIADNAFLSTIGGGRNYSFGTGDTYISGYSPNAPSNPNLRWEETAQTNIGFDAVLFNDLNITFEWFKKKTSGLLQNPPIPLYVGAISNPAANIGDMQNTGVELELGYRKKVGQFNFEINGNVSHITNKVTYLGNGQKFLGGAGFQGIEGGITRTTVGQAYNSFYGYQNLGIFQTQDEINAYRSAKGQLIQPNAKPGDFKWADLDGNGVINDQDRTYIGNPTPSWIYGLTFNTRYKNFDLVIFGQGQAGNMIFQGLHRLDIGNANFTTKRLERWTGPGTTNTEPRVVDGDPNHNTTYNSKYYLEKGDYFRIKNLQIGYSLPTDLIKKAGMKRVRVYVTGENLFTFTKYSGYDPEIGGGSYSIDRGFYMQAKSYMLGVSVGF
ncbi:TonB-dependent receptor [Mucilaginibacter sp. RS28]|uniref:TonB-dependent receptor n=1 Tax=Mucilaginibacter straminoryzae TaxID=2932774 RepID=A0A9X1X8A8_9SPHI|nr:TonB-dependent receptor [Mucilaginibacter straminoryzae]MCJ8212005.1 TonB-dependent receptor [Mucilaginibacter straminoryzae]